MTLIIGSIYKTQSGSFLRLESKGEILYNFILVDSENIPIPEKRNRFGHVVLRNKVSYGEETVVSFKKIKWQKEN